MKQTLLAISIASMLAACGGNGPDVQTNVTVSVTAGSVADSGSTSGATADSGSASVAAAQSGSNSAAGSNSGASSNSNISEGSSSSASSSAGNCGNGVGNGQGNGCKPAAIAQLTPGLPAVSVPSQVLPAQQAPAYVGGYSKHVTDGYEGSEDRGHVSHGSTFVPAAKSVAAQIAEMAADPSLNPTAHTNLLRLAKGAENLEALRAALVPGDRDGYVKAVRFGCQYESMRVTTQWHMTVGQHATISEQQDEGARFRTAYQACGTAGDSMADADLQAAVREELKLPVDPMLPPAPPADASGDFYAMRSGALDRIGHNFNKVAVARQELIGFDGPEYRRLNKLYSALSAQMQAWRSSTTVEEVRAKIDDIAARFYAN